MPSLFLYPIIPAIILGIASWLYGRKNGYTSKIQLAMTILIFYTGFYMLFKKIL